MKWVLVLGGATLPQGKILTKELKSLSYKVLLTDVAKQINNRSIIDEIGADSLLSLDFTDVKSCIDCFNCYKNEFNIVKVISYREEGVFAASVLNSLIDSDIIEGNFTSPASINTIRNKFICRNIIKLLGYKQPQSWLVESKLRLQELLEKLSINDKNQYILKPISGMGSIDVFLLPRDLKLINSINISESYTFVLEEFVKGKEFSAEGTYFNGRPQVLAITEKHLLPNTFAENGHNIPASLTIFQEKLIKQTIEYVLNYLGVYYSTFHVEFWLNENELTLGEFHARPGGQLISLMAELYSGVSLYSSAISNKKQLSYENKKKYKLFAVRSFDKGTGGIIDKIIIPDKIKKIDNLIYLKETLKSGSIIPKDNDTNMSEIGLFVVGANTREELDVIVNDIYKNIKVIYK